MRQRYLVALPAPTRCSVWKAHDHAQVPMFVDRQRFVVEVDLVVAGLQRGYCAEVTAFGRTIPPSAKMRRLSLQVLDKRQERRAFRRDCQIISKAGDQARAVFVKRVMPRAQTRIGKHPSQEVAIAPVA